MPPCYLIGWWINVVLCRFTMINVTVPFHNCNNMYVLRVIWLAGKYIGCAAWLRGEDSGAGRYGPTGRQEDEVHFLRNKTEARRRIKGFNGRRKVSIHKQGSSSCLWSTASTAVGRYPQAEDPLICSNGATYSPSSVHNSLTDNGFKIDGQMSRPIS